ncbi:winged helix-turn-helix domain-containing protein [Telluria aromaticivorans]|uniref:Transcriptional regulator n=1 Tax=Telluria aromaticivorans TaxID=2725995 RepID=A0A7Y2JWG2_9BURK|nr:transcriptional regulator [Telluria aromaticivorans]NNG21983.1 transcriptional regulator [Telluria aromaticivorans]
MASDMHARETYAFLDFELAPARRQLLKGDRPLAIGGRAFDLLALFASRPGEVLGPETLMRGAWPGAVVEEVNLRVQVAALRRLLHGAGEQPCIATVPGRGYCFTARVQRLAPMPLLASREPAPAVA